MIINKLKLYYFTILNLKLSQIYFRIYYIIRNSFFGRGLVNSIDLNIKIYNLNFFTHFINYPDSLNKEKITFEFLGKKKSFKSISEIDFDSQDYGELWCYNLNYFDFLNQINNNFLVEKTIIEEWVDRNYKSKNIVWDPYPVSMRLVNLIKWFSTNYHRFDKKTKIYFLKFIKKHDLYLRKNIEFHLDGNHLLENYISLLISSIFFNSDNEIKSDFNNLNNEIKNQFLSDNFHYERSIMYHNLLVEKLLNIISVGKDIKHSYEFDTNLSNLHESISKMLIVTNNFLYPTYSYPSFNDVVRFKDKRIIDVIRYSQKLKFNSIKKYKNINLEASGYLKFEFKNSIFIYDYGDIAPKFIPGHGHCDCFSFEFFHNNTPIIVNTGTSTYEYGDRRCIERSTSSHNTISFGENQQDEIWSRFRVARQHMVEYFKLTSFTKTKLSFSGSLTNYNNQYRHRRNVSIENNILMISDKLKSFDKTILPNLNLHFHPNVKIQRKSEDNFLINGTLVLEIKNCKNILLTDYLYADDYGKTINSLKIEALVIENNSKILLKNI